jgi:hypothetical protein
MIQEFYFGMKKLSFFNYKEMIIEQYFECTKYTEVFTFKGLILLSDFHLNFYFIKQWVSL